MGLWVWRMLNGRHIGLEKRLVARVQDAFLGAKFKDWGVGLACRLWV